jgi:2-dehydropantoate 2-reductase
MTEAMAEVIDCAAEEGVHLTHEDIEHWYPILDSIPPEGKTSMCQDVEAKRKTEVEMFAGTLIELAEKHGLPVPVNRTLYRLLKAKELMYLER